jgi:hypothetical protein
MHTIARALAPLLLTLGLLAGMTGTANADVPSNVRDGHAGTLEAGWVRAACATTATGVKCALRFPEGAQRVDLTYRLGGRDLAVETTTPYRAEHRTTPAPSRATGGTVVAGVRLTCAGKGQRVECVLDLAPRFADFSVTTYVAGWNYGGLRGSDVTA